MSYRTPYKREGHCSRGLLLLALLFALPCAWPQQQNPRKPAIAAPTKPAEKPQKLNLYIGHARELLSDTQWQNLLANQSTEPECPLRNARLAGVTSPSLHEMFCDFTFVRSV